MQMHLITSRIYVPLLSEIETDMFTAAHDLLLAVIQVKSNSFSAVDKFRIFRVLYHKPRDVES